MRARLAGAVRNCRFGSLDLCVTAWTASLVDGTGCSDVDSSAMSVSAARAPSRLGPQFDWSFSGGCERNVDVRACEEREYFHNVVGSERRERRARVLTLAFDGCPLVRLSVSRAVKSVAIDFFSDRGCRVAAFFRRTAGYGPYYSRPEFGFLPRLGFSTVMGSSTKYGTLQLFQLTVSNLGAPLA